MTWYILLAVVSFFLLIDLWLWHRTNEALDCAIATLKRADLHHAEALKALAKLEAKSNAAGEPRRLITPCNEPDRLTYPFDQTRDYGG